VNDKAATGYGESKSLTIIIEGKECVDEINRSLYLSSWLVRPHSENVHYIDMHMTFLLAIINS
jgi:hypothetical protein